MEEDTEYKKLPVDERCVHKLWKARLDGYEELIKIFRGIDDEKAPEWNKYLGLVKKFVIDSHAMAQERGLEATLIFVENAGNAGKTVGDVMSGLVTKCFSAPKAKIKDLAFQIVLMYIEIEKQDATIDELCKGLEAKNPKIVAATIMVLTQALREFGNKVVSIKPFIKKIPILLADRDKNVRDETKLLTVEMFRWIGPALKPHIASLAAVLLTELDGEFDKVKGEKAEPTRYLKSQQEKQQAIQAAGGGEDDAADDDADNQQEEMDPMDLIDPVDILSKLPKDFYPKLEEKKWQERKESLEALNTLLQNAKLENGDYGDLVRALKKVITKDTNVVLVAMAGKCLASLAKGVGKKFSPYAGSCVSGILEKFKEKKANVVTALREAIDAIYPSTTLETLQEDLLEALNNKNPSIKSETASFLARAFARTQPAILNKKLIKTFCVALLKTLNESDPVVRDCSAEALGTLSKLLGEKAVGPHFVDVDALKMAKIKECSEKAEIFVKVAAAKKERPTTAPPSSAPPKKAGSTEAKPVVRPNSTVAARKTVPAGGAKRPAASKGNAVAKSASMAKVLPTERELSPEEVDEKAAELLSVEILSGLTDSNWKTRLATAETFLGSIDGIETETGNSQVLAKTLCKKPGLKETNFQVLKLRLDALVAITNKLGMTTTTADSFSNEIVMLLGDAKNSAGASQVLTAVAEAISLEYVVFKMIGIAFEQKSPKVQAETLNWVANAIKEFGMQVNPKTLLDEVKKAVQSINPAVRSAAIQLLGTMHLYMGNALTMLFDGEKPALKQQIQAEFDKNTDQKPPKPIRGLKALSSSSSDNDTYEEPEADEPEIKSTDISPRIDISPQITEALLAEMEDKNWKTRNEGLNKLINILRESKLIKPTIGDLPLALGRRLMDSNAKIAQTSMQICTELAESMGPSCKVHVRTFFPGFLNGLSDSKAVMRTAAMTCINAWGDQCGYKEFFDGEMIADALKSGSPALRSELWGWLSEKLPTLPPKSIPKDEILACLPYLYANICDRSADVRKNANEAVLGCMLHAGYEPMFKAMEQQKSASKKTIQAALDKARPSLPVKPLPKGKIQAPVDETKTVKAGPGSKTQKAAAPAKGGAAANTRKKDEDVDTAPLLSTNNQKNQRMLDEQKLKVLKWSFTTPREEFTELLRDQMTAANVNKNLIANMFHEDFRYHLKVIEALQDDLIPNSRPLMCNLDLILKWISLRFYDTNPSVLLKGIDYLNLVMQMLISSEYDLTEVEGSSFLPHLLVKLGDPKDAVRNGVRSLFRQICLTYPYTKVFSCIMDGLKSKNARQRTECLDELGYLIETYGMGACQPSAQIALKEIARHIADRDNSVRSAALNCVVQAYFIVDEKVYKLIGQLSDKDLSMLDERIKRAKKTRKVPVEVPTKPMPVVKQELHQPDEGDEMMDEDEQEPEQQHESPPRIAVPEVQESPRTKPSGPFNLAQDFIDDIEKDWVQSDKWNRAKILEVNSDFLHSPLRSADVNGVSYPADRLQRLISNAPSHLITTGTHQMNYTIGSPSAVPNTSPSTLQNLPDILPKLDPNLLKILRSVGSSDTITARAGLNELNDILESSDKQAALRDYEEIYVENVCLQLRNLSQIPMSEALAIYQPLLSSLYSFYTSRTLGKNVGIEPLKKLMALIIGLMVDQKLPNSEENEYTKVVNGICLKIFDKSNFTNIICALIRLLRETCSGAGLPKFTDLLMKCIWRNVKNLPEKSNELDYDVVLLEVHEFMVTLPSSYWHQRHADTPHRTVKTIIHHLAQIKGNTILQHLAKIPTHSELYSYLLKVLKNIQKDGGCQKPLPTTPSKTATKRNAVQNHEAISAIFKLISDKETGREGIQKLYEFKQKHPEVDVEHYLHGSNPIFRKFIDDGLAELERAATENNQSDNKVLSENRFGLTKANNAGNEADFWMARLNALKKSVKGTDSNTDNRSSSENLNVNVLSQKNNFIAPKEPTDTISASPNIENIKQRLAQMRIQK